MGFGEELTNLGEGMLGSFDARVNFLGKNIVDTKRLRQGARQLVAKFHRDQRAMGRKLKADLGGFVDDLTGTVDSLRHKFQKQQKAIHQECKTAHQGWMRVAKTLAQKRHNFGANLTRAKQKAASH